MTEGTTNLNVAMIGYGFMGRAHSNAFHQVSRFFDITYQIRLKAICGRNREQAELVATRWGWESVETDWRAVIERKDIDVVDICVPNRWHAPIAIAAAKAGKIVLCEKPLAMQSEEAGEMAKAARKVPNLVWFNYRRVPAVTLAKSLVDAGKIGEVFHYRATYLQSWGVNPSNPDAWRFHPSEAGSGASGDLLAHSLDLALLLNGPIKEINALTQTFAPGREVDDAVIAMARFANGSVGTFEATRFAVGCQNRNYFEIHGSKGALRFDLEEMNHLQFFDASDSVDVRGSHRILATGPSHPYVDRYWPPGHVIGYEHTFTSTLADFLIGLKAGVRFRPDFDDGVAVQVLLDAVGQSSKSKQWVEV